MAAPNKSVGYEVGYKKPPKHTQFKKGQSGNPKGRKKGSRNRLSYNLPSELLREAVIQEARREIEINDSGRKVTMPTFQAILRALNMRAMKGNVRAQQLALKLTSEEERNLRAEAEARAEWLIGYKQHLEKKLENGHNGKNMVPHPNQIILDSKTGEMYIEGPLSLEEKEEDELYRALLSRKKVRKSEITACLEKTSCEEERLRLQTELDDYEGTIKALEIIVGHEHGGQELSLYQSVKKLGIYDRMAAPTTIDNGEK